MGQATDGVTKTYSQWEKEIGLSEGLISQRKLIQKWSDEECLEPVRRNENE